MDDCDSCHIMAPFFRHLAEMNRHVRCGSVNIDQWKEAKSEFGISEVPTFILFRAGKEAERVEGPNRARLEKVFEDFQ